MPTQVAWLQRGSRPVWIHRRENDEWSSTNRSCDGFGEVTVVVGDSAIGVGDVDGHGALDLVVGAVAVVDSLASVAWTRSNTSFRSWLVSNDEVGHESARLCGEYKSMTFVRMSGRSTRRSATTRVPTQKDRALARLGLGCPRFLTGRLLLARTS